MAGSSRSAAAGLILPILTSESRTLLTTLVTCRNEYDGRILANSSTTYLDEASRVVAVQVHQDEAALLRDAQLVDAGLDELVGGHLLVLLLALLVGLCIGDDQRVAGPQGVVQLHQRVAAAEGAPQQGDGVDGLIFVGALLLLQQPALDARDTAQAQLQRQAALEQGGVLVGALVEDAVAGLDGPAVHGGRGQRGEGGRRLAEQRRGGGGIGALGVARAVVRVAAVLALEALVGHEGWLPAGGIHARVRMRRGGGGRRMRALHFHGCR
jgi:hypothetical protein